MKAIKDYNGEHVFIGDPDNDKEALLHLLETIVRTVADALNMSTVQVLSVINTKIIAEAMQRQKEEE